MIVIREAEERDVEGVREIFVATYGVDYPHPEFFDILSLKKIVFDDDTLLLVAEEEEWRFVYELEGINVHKRIKEGSRFL